MIGVEGLVEIMLEVDISKRSGVLCISAINILVL